MMTPRRVMLGLSLALLLVSGPGWPQGKAPAKRGGERSQPITVIADRLEADDRRRIITFTGNVIAKQADLVLTADVLTATYEGRQRDLRELNARGNVKIVQENKVAVADRAVFYNDERKIVLTGNARIWQERDVVSGDRITVYLNEETSVVEGSRAKRVEAVLHPREEKKESAR
ncbi:MAG: lipopolysaccharide transport periplasmic protein LptA [Deltaproteobacteria bacterium]|nr:lipopolysaccharide transport periplasmic protein LptA [Deltaproteobacteria bacterium]